MKYKKGDIVNIDPDRSGASWFKGELTGLEIEEVDNHDDTYEVYEQDKSDSWWVTEKSILNQVRACSKKLDLQDKIAGQEKILEVLYDELAEMEEEEEPKKLEYLSNSGDWNKSAYKSLIDATHFIEELGKDEDYTYTKIGPLLYRVER